jgi:hypothetical protein
MASPIRQIGSDSNRYPSAGQSTGLSATIIATTASTSGCHEFELPELGLDPGLSLLKSGAIQFISLTQI